MVKKIEINELRVGMCVKALSKSKYTIDMALKVPRLVKSVHDIQHLYDEGYIFVYLNDADDEPAPAPEVEAPVIEEPVKKKAAKPKKDVAAKQVDGDDELVIVGGWELPVGGAEVDDSDLLVSFEDDDEAPPEEDTVEFVEEVKRAEVIKEEAGEVVKDFLNDARSGKGIDGDRTQEVVSNMVNSVFRNRDAMMSLARLKDYDNYTFGHSVNVCILTLALGRHMKFSRRDLQALGTGAMLHDVGKMLVPETILNKPDKLSDEEYMKMQNHVSLGGELLYKSGGIDDKSIRVAMEHHEKHDGSGYPNRLSGEEISLFGKISAIVDVYDALTSTRVYRKRNPIANEALKMIFNARGSHFDPLMVDNFVKCLGIYPIGSFVRLNSGEKALVKSVNHKSLLKPTVSIIYDVYSLRVKKPFDMDLSILPNVYIENSIQTEMTEDEIHSIIG